MANNERINFCQEPSKQYLQWLDEAGGDPRSVAGKRPGVDGRISYLGVPGKHHINNERATYRRGSQVIVFERR